jgi:peptide chain release factor 2
MGSFRACGVTLTLVATTDFDSEIKTLQATMHTIEQVLDVDQMRRDIADLGEQVAAPDLWDDQDNAQRVTGRLSTLNGELERFTGLSDRIDDLALMVEMAQDEGDADTLEESERELVRLQKSVEALEVRTLLNGEYDAREAIVSIRSGAGGVDAADFAEQLMRMYTRWAERHKYPVEVFDVSYAEEAGIKSASSRCAPLRLRHAVGRVRHAPPRAHQPVRQPGPPADVVRRGRGHPAVTRADRRDRGRRERHPHRRLPLRWPGRPVGQHHRLRGAPDAHPDRHRRLLPEREVAAAEQGLRDGRPQGQAPRSEEGRGSSAEEGPQGRRRRRAWGDQMRNYVLNPYQLVKDLRTGLESGNPSAVLDGEIDDFLEAGIRFRRGGVEQSA